MGCRLCKSKGDPNDSLLKNIIKTNKVVIFSRTNCPYCIQVKTLFSQMGVGYAVIELDHCHNVEKLVKALTAKTNHFTVPQVFIDGQFIGGECDIWHLKSTGELRALLLKVFPGLGYANLYEPLEDIPSCSPTIVGPRTGIPKSWSTPAFNKYKPLAPGVPPFAQQIPVSMRTLPYPMYGPKGMRCKTTPDFCCSCCKKKPQESRCEKELNELINYERVVIFSKTACPFCDDAKKIFRLMNSDFAAMELDALSPHSGIIKALKAKTGFHTVPQIFIDGQFIGGICELKAMRNSGELQDLLCRVSPVCITTKSMRSNTGCSPGIQKPGKGPCIVDCSAIPSGFANSSPSSGKTSSSRCRSCS